MNQEGVVGLLKGALDEVASLRALRRGNQEFDLWYNNICDLIEMGFGKKSTEYERFARAVTMQYFPPSEAEQQKAYNSELDSYETALKSILRKHALLASLDKSGIGPHQNPNLGAAQPKAFIAHGGESLALAKVEEFLRALGVTPMIAERQPSEGRLTEQQVDKYLQQTDCAIILATEGGIVDTKTQIRHPRLNVIDELGRCRRHFPNKTILLLEQGVELPSNDSAIIYERFTQDNLEKAFLKIARELVASGLIKAVKPEQTAQRQS